MSAPMDLESKQQDGPGASSRVPSAVDLSRWRVDTAVEAREYDADSAENEVLLPEVESIAKSRLSRVILPSGTVVLCSGAVLLRQCLAVQPYKDQLLSQAIVLNFQPVHLFPDDSLIEFFSRLHRFNLKEDEPLADAKAGWKPEWCYLVRALNMPTVYPEAQKSLGKLFERGERVWDWIRLLRHSNPDDRNFRDHVVNALTGLAKPHFVRCISDEHLDDLFSILDEDDWFLLANSKWIYRFDLPPQPVVEDLPAGEGEPPKFLFPKMQFKAIPFQQPQGVSTEPRTVTVEAAAGLAPAQQVHIVVSPKLTIVASLDVLRRKSRLVEAAAEGASGPVEVRLEGAEYMKEDAVISFFNMLHHDHNLKGVEPKQWAICWVVLADQLQVEVIQDSLNKWFWGLKQITYSKDFWHWVAASRLRSVQRSRPADAPSTATREDVFNILESSKAHAVLYRAVVVEREQFRREYDVSHVIRLLRIVA